MDAANELPYWLALRRAGLGTSNFALLMRHFESIERAWHAPSDEVARAGVEPQFVRSIEKARARFDPDGELDLLKKHQIRACTWLHDDYPASLRNINQSPPVLFLHGTCGPEFNQAVAIVGTRQVTPYGRQACEHFAEALAAAGVAIISGLARGWTPSRTVLRWNTGHQRWPCSRAGWTRCSRKRMPGSPSASPRTAAS